MGASSMCRGCGATGTVRAHLIPRSFVHDLRVAQKHIYIGWAERNGRKVTQSGLIDEDILCGKYDVQVCPAPSTIVFTIRMATCRYMECSRGCRRASPAT
jgi:hypothetical protein